MHPALPLWQLACVLQAEGLLGIREGMPTDFFPIRSRKREEASEINQRSYLPDQPLRDPYAAVPSSLIPQIPLKERRFPGPALALLFLWLHMCATLYYLVRRFKPYRLLNCRVFHEPSTAQDTASPFSEMSLAATLLTPPVPLTWAPQFLISFCVGVGREGEDWF